MRELHCLLFSAQSICYIGEPCRARPQAVYNFGVAPERSGARLGADIIISDSPRTVTDTPRTVTHPLSLWVTSRDTRGEGSGELTPLHQLTTDIHQVELLNKLSVLLTWQHLGHPIRGHTVREDPLNFETTCLNLLPHP
jgi:hypothetical protein